MFLARSGWEMTVGYVAGDPDRPIGLYRNINGEMPPAYPQPASKSAMSIRTASSGGGGGGYSEIKLDDAAGAQAFDVRAERDYSAQVKNDRKEVVGADDIRVVGNDYTSSVKGSRGTTVSGNHAMVGNKNWLEHIKGDRTITIGASESVSIGGGQTLTTKGSEAETIGGSRITIAGGVSTEGLIKMAKEAIPTPKSLVKSVLTGAATKAIEPAAESVAALKGAKGIPGSLTGAFGGVTRPDGLIGGVEGMIGGYEGAKGALDSAGKALDAAKGLPSAIKSVLPKAQVRALAGAKEAAINALESIVPSPSAILGALLTGSIQRNAKGAFRRTVGAAAVSAAVDEVSVTAGRTFVETVGGAKITISTADIAEKVGPVLATTVGGAIIRKSAGPITVESLNARTKVGVSASFIADCAMMIEGGTVALRAESALEMDGGGFYLKLSSEGVVMDGDIALDAKANTTIKGNVLDVTKG
jgi:type VI secretion system secreted protein VgrG